jgi:hypothetical protein
MASFYGRIIYGRNTSLKFELVVALSFSEWACPRIGGVDVSQPGDLRLGIRMRFTVRSYNE